MSREQRKERWMQETMPGHYAVDGYKRRRAEDDDRAVRRDTPSGRMKGTSTVTLCRRCCWFGGRAGWFGFLNVLITVQPRLFDRCLGISLVVPYQLDPARGRIPNGVLKTELAPTHLDSSFVLLYVLLEHIGRFNIGGTTVSPAPVSPHGLIYAILPALHTHLAGFGSFSRLCTLVRTAATSYVGDHLFCRMSRHSSPLL